MDFWRILQKCLLACVGVDRVDFVRILTKSSRAPRSGVGLVPVAVNEYSPQKCRCKPGACLVSAGVRACISIAGFGEFSKGRGAAWCRPVFGRCQGITRSEIVRLRASV